MVSQERSRGSDDYVRFMILAGPRTGSTMLASSLHSHAEITCFGELFNYAQEEIIDFRVDGYDPTNAEDRALRDGDYKEFLRRRIFCAHPGSVRAVGFKFLYDHVWGYKGLLDWLEADREMRIVHLRRRNELRTLVSLRIALASGRWVEARGSARAVPTNRRGIKRIAWLPQIVAGLLQGRIRRDAVRKNRQEGPSRELNRPTLYLSPDKCQYFFRKNKWDEAYYRKFFAQHQTCRVFYEDIMKDEQAALASVQEFLGVEPRQLAPATLRQNPQPLSELIANFDDLRAAFRDTEYAWMFEDG